MFGVGNAIKAIAVIIVVVVVAGGFWYISNLKANLAVSKLNEEKLQGAIETQQEVIESMKRDLAHIQEVNKELSNKVDAAKRDADALAEKFNKRDFGTISAAKPKVAEKLVNRGTAAVARCFEIASGAPLTEEEKNATKVSEINRECPSIANPNYTPVTP